MGNEQLRQVRGQVLPVVQPAGGPLTQYHDDVLPPPCLPSSPPAQAVLLAAEVLLALHSGLPAAPRRVVSLSIALMPLLALSWGLALGPCGHDLAAAWGFSAGDAPGVQGSAQAGAQGGAQGGFARQPLHAKPGAPAGPPGNG